MVIGKSNFLFCKIHWTNSISFSSQRSFLAPPPAILNLCKSFCFFRVSSNFIQSLIVLRSIPYLFDNECRDSDLCWLIIYNFSFMVYLFFLMFPFYSFGFFFSSSLSLEVSLFISTSSIKLNEYLFLLK